MTNRSDSGGARSFEVFHQVTEHDRHELGGLDLFALDEVQQFSGLEHGFLRANHQFPARSEGPHQVARENVEAEAGHLQMRADVQLQAVRLFPAEIGVQQIAVRDHHALRAARRA